MRLNAVRGVGKLYNSDVNTMAGSARLSRKRTVSGPWYASCVPWTYYARRSNLFSGVQQDMSEFIYAHSRNTSGEHGEKTIKFGRSSKNNPSLRSYWHQPWFIGCFVLFLMAFLFAIPQAKAGFLGNTVEIFDRVQSPGLGFPGPPAPVDTSRFVGVVGVQTEFSSLADFIDVADTRITLGSNGLDCVPVNNVCNTPLLVGGDFFGYGIADMLDQIDPIIGVSLVSSTIAGFDIGDISFSENGIFFSIESLVAFVPGLVIPIGEAVIEVTFASTGAVSEPADFAIFGVGLLGLMSMRRRARS